MQNRRRTILIDRTTQLRIARCMILYWIVGGSLVLLAPVALTFGYSFFLTTTTPVMLIDDLLCSIGIAAVAGIIIVPFGSRALIHFSHRIAGPMFRLKREMENLASGKEVQPIQLRQGDFFVDVVESFNRLLIEHKKLKVRYQQLLDETATRERDAFHIGTATEDYLEDAGSRETRD